MTPRTHVVQDGKHCPLKLEFLLGLRFPWVALQADFNLTYAQLGLMPALYMAGLMVACLVFNELTNHVNSFRLVGEPQELLLCVADCRRLAK